MRAMVLRRQKPVERRPLACVERETPEPGPGELLLRVRYCGICRTDLHLVEGDMPLRRRPIVPGHQAVGVIEEMGRGVTGCKRGQRVGVPWIAGSCGACMHCRQGRENLCERLAFHGWTRDGGFASHMTVRADCAFPLPRLPDEHVAPLLCAGVVGYRALRRARIERGSTVALWGFGSSAHIGIQILRHWDCKIQVFTRSRAHQGHARALGASWVGSPKARAPSLSESAVIYAPVGELVPRALRNLAPGGTLALADIHMTPLPTMEYALLWKEKTVTSVANSTRDDVRELLRLAARIPLRSEVTLFPLEKANEALLAVKRSRLRGSAVLVNEA